MFAMKPAPAPCQTAREQADVWWARLHSGHATQADASEFKAWLAQSPEHQHAWRELNRVVHTFTPALGQARAQNPPSHIPVSIGRRAWMGTAIAASTVGLLAWRPPLGLWPALGDFTADFRTAAGESREFFLGDAVAVHMNTKTTINNRSMPSRSHQLELLSGEAEIRVGRGASQPLVLLAGECRVQAHAASFNVSYLDTLVRLSCLEGRVWVESLGLSLEQGQQLQYQSRQDWSIKKINPEQSQTWRKGYLEFNGAPLAQVVDELNRYRNGKIYIRSAHLGEQTVHFQLAIRDMDLALDMLRSLPGLRVQELTAGVALISQA